MPQEKQNVKKILRLKINEKILRIQETVTNTKDR